MEKQLPPVDPVLAFFSRLARRVGVWPASGRGVLSPAALVVVPAHLFFFALTALELGHNRSDVEAATETLQFLTMYSSTFHKWIVMMWRHRDFERLRSTVEGCFGVPRQRTSVRYKALVASGMRPARWISGLWGCSVVVDVAAIVLRPLLTTSNTYPFRNWTPFDQAPEPYHSILFIYHVFMGATLICMVPMYDIFFYSFMHHACAQYSILQVSLQELGERATSAKTPLASDKQLKEAVADCARHHEEINKFVRDLESIVSTVFLSQFSASSLFYCTVALQIAVRTVFDSKMMVLIILLAGSMFQLGTFCYVGNRLMNESTKVGFAAYDIEWYEIPQFAKRSIQIMMMRCRDPAQITFGKFAPLSMQTFASILRLSYSYFTVLNQLHE